MVVVYTFFFLGGGGCPQRAAARVDGAIEGVVDGEPEPKPLRKRPGTGTQDGLF